MDVLIWGFAIFGAYMLWKTVIRGLLAGRIPIVTGRGLLAVKAAIYLMILEHGGTPDEGNMTVREYDENVLESIIVEAIEYIGQRYNGQQLPMIAEARAKGFLG